MTDQRSAASGSLFKTLDGHQIEVAQHSHYDGPTAKCSCGWESQEMGTESGAVRKGLAHLQEVKANG